MVIQIKLQKQTHSTHRTDHWDHAGHIYQVLEVSVSDRKVSMWMDIHSILLAIGINGRNDLVDHHGFEIPSTERINKLMHLLH